MKPENIARNARIFEAVALGASPNSIAKTEGICGQNARGIIQKMRLVMRHPQSLGTDTLQDEDWQSIRVFRDNADFWLTQLAKWRSKHQQPSG